jgi:hypothetical protein
MARFKELVPFGTSQIAHRESAGGEESERDQALRTLTSFMKELLQMLNKALNSDSSTGGAPKKSAGNTPVDGDFHPGMEAWRRGWRPTMTEADKARSFAAKLR